MERLKNTKVVQGGYLYYTIDGVRYKLGELRKEFLLDRLFFAFVFDLDQNVIEEMWKKHPYLGLCFIPGIELDEGFYQAFSRLPFFISMRVADSRREDIQTFLDRFGMEEYDAFTMLLRNHGRSDDPFYIEEFEVE